MDKNVEKYTKLYEDELIYNGFADARKKAAAYAERLTEMYASEAFRSHNVYPTVDTVKVYAVIAMCLELKEDGLLDPEIIEFVNHSFHRLKQFFNILLGAINVLPNSFEIAKKWNIGDHDKRVKDGSVFYEQFDVSKDRIEYRVTRCAYVEMFEYYGIRKLCKLFCMTDTTSYASLPKHVRFERYSDLSDGDCCHDVVTKK